MLNPCVHAKSSRKHTIWVFFFLGDGRIDNMKENSENFKT